MLLIRDERPFTLPAIFTIIHSLSLKQPQKYLKLHFSGSGIGISTLDDSGTILLGVEIKKEAFQSHIVEKNINLYFPVFKFAKILQLPTLNDDSITLSYEHDTEHKSMKQLSIRIHSKKNNEKLHVLMKIESQFGQMISEKYEQPTNPIDYYATLRRDRNARMTGNLLQPNMTGIICQFKIPSIEFIRICTQFMQVADRVVIQYYSQRNDNKKYLTFSTYQQPNTKSITLNQQKTIAQLQYEQSELYALHTNYPKIDISSVFLIQTLWKISKISTENEVLFNEDIRIVMEKGKYLLVVHEFAGDVGQLVSMVDASPL